MNARERTTQELADLRRQLRAIAAGSPSTVLLAMLDQLVDSICGDNPALLEVKRLQFYRGVIGKLRSGGAA